MEMKQRLIKKLSLEKDKQFGNLTKYCLHAEKESLHSVERFLCILNEASLMLGDEELAVMCRKLYSHLKSDKDCKKSNEDSLFRILSLYSSIYSRIEKLEIDLYSVDTAEQDACLDYQGTSATYRGKILVVDDDPIILSLLENIFKKRGYDVILCSNPFEVTRIIKERKIDVLILDLMMPKIHGYEIVKIIRKNELRLPIIILSGHNNIESKVKALGIGADDYITKPFQEQELIARVERTLARSLNFNLLHIEDRLTGAYTKNYLWKKMEEIKSSYGRNKKVFSIAFVDMDCFKNINDTYGHLTGDEVLKCFVSWLKLFLRPTDFIFRFGGDEFIILFPETSEENVHNILERFRIKMEYGQYFEEKKGNLLEISFSAGITEVKENDNEIEEIIERADIALYQAKRQGRSKTCIYGKYKRCQIK